ncbi:MAG TPA: TIGR04255 family protein [Kribbellaceae bacterium]|nr:TIGR04255 family protein [Kribbellaceae bacterium]
MALTLPEADDTALARPPLAVVVAQARYEQNLALSDGATVLKIHSDLGGRAGQYGVIEPQQIVATQLEIGPAGVASIGSAQGMPARGYRLKSADGSWIASIMPEFVSLETTAYTSWSGEFSGRWAEVLKAVATHVEPRIEDRLGLRYVNHLKEPEFQEPKDWIGAIAPEFLGPTSMAHWAESTIGYQQQLELDAGDDIHCMIRSGFIPRSSGGVEGYLLDIDVFRRSPRKFDADEILVASHHFNRTALSLFQRSLTPDYLSALRKG